MDRHRWTSETWRTGRRLLWTLGLPHGVGEGSTRQMPSGAGGRDRVRRTGVAEGRTRLPGGALIGEERVQTRYGSRRRGPAGPERRPGKGVARNPKIPGTSLPLVSRLKFHLLKPTLLVHTDQPTTIPFPSRDVPATWTPHSETS